MGEITIRDAHEEELDKVAELHIAAYSQYFPVVYADDGERAAWDDYARDMRDTRGRWPVSRLIVAEDAGRLLGAVTYYPSNSGPTVGEGWPSGTASFRLLAVHPDARGRGLGRLLTEECVRRALGEGAEAIGLHSTEIMSVARAMYERMGWSRTPEHDFRPIEDRPDFVVMAYRRALP